MERSDSQQPSEADPAAPNPEPAKGPAQPQSAPADPPASLAEPPLHLTEAESDAIERTYFDRLERETTQPVRRPLAYADTPPAEDARIEALGASVPAEFEDAGSRAFEPQPFAVPAPPDARPTWSELLATPAQEPEAEPDLPSEAVAQSEPEPQPELYFDAGQPVSIEAPYVPVRLEIPPREERREPWFDTVAADAPVSLPADETLPAIAATRDWRDIVRRTANVAFLVFAGWFIAVLVLIVAYRFINPPFSMLMAQRFVTGTPIENDWVPIERISPNLSRAVIVAEDGRFCQHWGIDFVEAANAIRRASDGYPRGASTITMQVAKNLFLVPAKSYLRKMIEIPLTLAIELAWPKQRILEVYLNIVEWGPGIFGAEAASRTHFGRSAEGLSSRQAAQLAAVLPNPIIRDAGAPGPRTAHKASIIQARAARTREASACIDIRR